MTIAVNARAVSLLLCLLFTPLALARDIESFELNSFAAIQNRHPGSSLLIVVWSVECSHCKQDLARIARRLRARPDLRVELIATDPPALRDAVRSTLDKLGLAGAPSWQFGLTPAPRLRAAIDPDWFGELPRSYLMGPDGTRMGISGRLPEAALDHWAELGR